MWKSSKYFFNGICFLLTLQSVLSEKKFTTDCCLLRRAELEMFAKATNQCLNTSKETLTNICSTCKLGKCRIGNDCVCAEVFLNTTRLQAMDCQKRFARPWPASVGAVDRSILACTSPAPKIEDFSPDCCVLNMTELDLRSRLTDGCPRKFHMLDHACEPCEPGLCRVNVLECICPTEFRSSFTHYFYGCRERFETKWPESAGSEDKVVKPCKHRKSTSAPTVVKTTSSVSSSTTTCSKDPSQRKPAEDGNGGKFWAWLGPTIAALAVPFIAWLLHRFCSGPEEAEKSEAKAEKTSAMQNIVVSINDDV